jgi:hypothetical protein
LRFHADAVRLQNTSFAIVTIYGTFVTRRLRTIGIRDKPTARASPWPVVIEGKRVLLIWMRSRGVICFLPRAMDDAPSRRLAER